MTTHDHLPWLLSFITIWMTLLAGNTAPVGREVNRTAGTVTADSHNLFGAGGNKDRGKRPMMGAAAAKLADIVVVTSDNPRMEDPKAIIKDITDGIKRKDGIYVEPDRRKAIKLAISLAKKDDIVVLAGKGHETYQDVMGKKAHFSDREEARAAVRNRGKK